MPGLAPRMVRSVRCSTRSARSPTRSACLAEHVADSGFRGDLVALVGEETGFDVDDAAALITESLLRRLDR